MLIRAVVRSTTNVGALLSTVVRQVHLDTAFARSRPRRRMRRAVSRRGGDPITRSDETVAISSAIRQHTREKYSPLGSAADQVRGLDLFDTAPAKKNLLVARLKYLHASHVTQVVRPIVLGRF